MESFLCLLCDVVSLATVLTFLVAGENKVSLTTELIEVSLLLFPFTKCLGRAKLGASALIWMLVDYDHLLYLFYLKIRLFRLSLHPYFFWCSSILQVTFSTTDYKEAKVLHTFPTILICMFVLPSQLQIENDVSFLRQSCKRHICLEVFVIVPMYHIRSV